MIKIARTKADLERCYQLLRELRQNLNQTDFFSIYDLAHSDDSYEIVYYEEAGAVLALMGYRKLHDFVHGTHFYVDDLVTTEANRSRGLGAKLLIHLESIAKEQGINSLRLCAALENERGRKFYELNGWMARSVAFKKRI